MKGFSDKIVMPEQKIDKSLDALKLVPTLFENLLESMVQGDAPGQILSISLEGWRSKLL